MTIVRQNLMTIEGYAPYCSNCSTMVRTWFNGEQFECLHKCGWVSDFPKAFIKVYKSKWNIKNGSSK